MTLKKPQKCQNECKNEATTMLYDEDRKTKRALCAECVAMELGNAVMEARRKEKREKK